MGVSVERDRKVSGVGMEEEMARGERKSWERPMNEE